MEAVVQVMAVSEAVAMSGASLLPVAVIAAEDTVIGLAVVQWVDWARAVMEMTRKVWLAEAEVAEV